MSFPTTAGSSSGGPNEIRKAGHASRLTGAWTCQRSARKLAARTVHEPRAAGHAQALGCSDLLPRTASEPVSRDKTGWPAAIALIGLAAIGEMVPLASGTGVDATWDWGFLYVTLHFVLLPIACFAHLGFRLRALKTQRPRPMASILASGFVPLCLLTLLYFHPLSWVP